MKKLLSAENVLNLLLIFVPIAIVLEVMHADPVYIFLASALAIIPLAGLMGKATEHLSEKLGEGVGGLLNATFGNAAELIIAVMALRAGLHDVVKASITGSIIGNVLLVFGLSALAGGLKFPTQYFNKTAASLGSTMLTLSAVGLVVPAIFHLVVGNDQGIAERELSVEISLVLLVSYALSLVFALKTHKHLYTSAVAGPEHEEGGGPLEAGGAEAAGGHAPAGSEEHGWSRGKSAGVLAGATTAVAVMSEFLVGAVEGAAKQTGMTELFVGVILVAIIGNAAEHSTAVLMALKNKMDLAINIAIGSSIQIALFVAPVLVLLSYLVGPAPMDLRFTTLEVVAVVLSVAIIALISVDGESNWMEGVQLLAMYVMLAMAFYLVPAVH